VWGKAVAISRLEPRTVRFDPTTLNTAWLYSDKGTLNQNSLRLTLNRRLDRSELRLAAGTASREDPNCGPESGSLVKRPARALAAFFPEAARLTYSCAA
jgi:hypothetical protein